MSHKRQVWETFSQLARRLLAAAETTSPPPGFGETTKELKRLGKAQFRASALQQATLEQLRQAMDQLSTHEQEARGQAGADAVHDLLTALVPVLDGLEAALDSGERLLAHSAPDSLDDRWVARHLDGGKDVEHAARLPLQSDRALMVAWLDGLRLVRDRLLALLADADVEPIPTVGHLFDPYLHQAVGTAGDSAYPSGIIVAEQRRGYTGPAGVLRYADVIVNREIGNPAIGDSETRMLNNESRIANSE